MNFKEVIERFLKKSLMVYLKYNDQIKKLIKDEELKNNYLISSFNDFNFEKKENLKNFGLVNLSNGNENDIQNYETDEKNLEKISEKSLENKGNNSLDENSELYYHNSSSSLGSGKENKNKLKKESEKKFENDYFEYPKKTNSLKNIFLGIKENKNEKKILNFLEKEKDTNLNKLKDKSENESNRVKFNYY